jgi:hypothetical protein
MVSPATSNCLFPTWQQVSRPNKTNDPYCRKLGYLVITAKVRLEVVPSPDKRPSSIQWIVRIDVIERKLPMRRHVLRCNTLRFLGSCRRVECSIGGLSCRLCNLQEQTSVVQHIAGPKLLSPKLHDVGRKIRAKLPGAIFISLQTLPAPRQTSIVPIPDQ